MSESNTPIVIDVGSGTLKAGWASDDAPVRVIPAVVGEPKQQKAMQGVEAKDRYVGEEALSKGALLALRYPVRAGKIQDWGDFELLLDHAFNQELRVEPSEYSILLTTSANATQSEREKLAQLLFEKFEVQGVYLQNRAVASLYAASRTTGLVLQSGASATWAVPVYEGFAVQKNIFQTQVGGRDVDYFLAKEQGLDSANLGSQVLQDMKEQVCYVAKDYESEIKKDASSISKKYKLPDGTEQTVGQGQFKAPEVLFRPDVMPEKEGEKMSVQRLCAAAIEKSDVDLRLPLACNIVLSGGNTLLPNFATRLEKELQALLPGPSKLSVWARPERKYDSWIGAALLARLSSFSEMMVTREEFEEEGASAVNRKCLT